MTMFLVCPRCLHARNEPVRSSGFQCQQCGHRWEAPAARFSQAYYAALAALDIHLLAEGGQKLALVGFPIELGRDSDFLPLQTNVAISRQHCRIELDKATGAFRVLDLASKGGTFVNTTAIAAQQSLPLRFGDRLRLSGLDLRFDAILRRAPAAASPAKRGESDLPLDGAPFVVLGLNHRGTLVSSKRDSGGLQPLALALFAQETGTCRLLALNRDQVQINGERFVERSLAPRDQIVLAGRTFVFNQAAGALQPEEAALGPGLTIHGLKFNAGRRAILYGLDCEIPSGKLTAIIGQSGSGKTTLLRVLSGNTIPNCGTLKVEGKELTSTGYARWARDNLALVPQADIVHQELTVRETLEFGAALRLGWRIGAGHKRERIERALLDLGLLDHQSQRIAKLSGGQRKRVNVAVELLSAPRVLLLDEPTTGLDYQTEHDVVHALRQLARQGRTVVFVTHSLASLELADHVIVIRADHTGGHVVEEGPPERIHSPDKRPSETMPRATRPNPTAALSDDDPPIGWLARVAARSPRFVALFCRYVRLWTSSPLAFCGSFLALPLALGILIRLAVSADGRLGADRMLLGLIAMIWLGMNQTVREAVKERDIFLREQSLRIGSASFLLSKLLFFAALALPQALLLSASLKWLAVEDWSLHFSLRDMTCPWSLLVMMCWLAGALGSCVGMFISCLCLFVRQKGEVVAVLLVILVTLPQILFSAKMVPEGLARDAEHYHSFVLWHDTARWPELLSYATASRYLFLPLDAVAREMPKPELALRFNLTVLTMSALIVIVLSWLALEVFVNRERRRR